MATCVTELGDTHLSEFAYTTQTSKQMLALKKWQARQVFFAKGLLINHILRPVYIYSGILKQV